MIYLIMPLVHLTCIIVCTTLGSEAHYLVNYRLESLLSPIDWGALAPPCPNCGHRLPHHTPAILKIIYIIYTLVCNLSSNLPDL